MLACWVGFEAAAPRSVHFNEHMFYIFRLHINDTVYPLSEKLPSQFCFS